MRRLILRWLFRETADLVPAMISDDSEENVSVHIYKAVGGQIVQASVFSPHSPNRCALPRFVPDGQSLSDAVAAAVMDLRLLRSK